MSDTVKTIADLRARHAALEEEKKLALSAQRDHETKARELSSRYFACKSEQQQIIEALRSANATLMEEQAISAAKQAQAAAEADKAESAALLDSLKAQQAAMDAKGKELEELLAKAKA
jgi:hypothetical protein